MQIISSSQFLLNLKLLDLSDDSVSDEGITYLMESKVSRKLETLILFGNVQVTSLSLKAIASSKECKSLQKLDLRSTYVSDEGMKVLHFFPCKFIHFLIFLNRNYVKAGIFKTSLTSISR